MDYDKLIEQAKKDATGSHPVVPSWAAIVGKKQLKEYATAIETLRADLARVTAELNDLRAQWDMYGGDVGITETYKELERVTAERDAAISDLECETIGTPRACDCCKNRENSQCKRNLLYGWCKWEWRGKKKEG